MNGQMWVNFEVQFIGATGINSVREMAELAIADVAVLETLDISTSSSADDVESALVKFGVYVFRVPSAVMRHERWDQSLMQPCGADAKPGRGYTKVFGVNYD